MGYVGWSDLQTCDRRRICICNMICTSGLLMTSCFHIMQRMDDVHVSSSSPDGATDRQRDRQTDRQTNKIQTWSQYWRVGHLPWGNYRNLIWNEARETRVHKCPWIRPCITYRPISIFWQFDHCIVIISSKLFACETVGVGCLLSPRCVLLNFTTVVMCTYVRFP